MKITIDHNISEEEKCLIRDEVIKYSDIHSSPRNFRSIALALREESGSVVGGVTAFIAWDWLLIEVLWVAEELRNKGHGSFLLKEIEKLAKKEKCNHSRLDTFDFEAKDFYLKNGYQVYGELKGFPGEHSQYHLRKDLK